MEPLYILIFIAVIVAIIAGAIYNHKKERERREALQRLAQELGWQFTPARDRHHDNQYANFEIFRRGHGRAAYNTLTGPLEIMGRTCPAKMGDFTYQVTSGSGKNRRTTRYHFSYLIAHLPILRERRRQEVRIRRDSPAHDGVSDARPTAGDRHRAWPSVSEQRPSALSSHCGTRRRRTMARRVRRRSMNRRS